jgi:hypothetical protein
MVLPSLRPQCPPWATAEPIPPNLLRAVEVGQGAWPLLPTQLLGLVVMAEGMVTEVVCLSHQLAALAE